ncbi:MAG: hypothetical protein LBM75_09320 [Myxococcales bacterium]|jgi:hypothetical protein|nr:hypothetical protein [Myxococcales bacterium]
MRAEELRANEEAVVAAAYWNERVRSGARVKIKGLPRRIAHEPGTTVGQAYVEDGKAVCRARHAEMPGIKPPYPIELLTPVFGDDVLEFHKALAIVVERHRQTAARRLVEAFNRAVPIETEVRIYGEGGLSILSWRTSTRAFVGKSGPVVAVKCQGSRQSRTVDVLDVMVRDESGGGGWSGAVPLEPCPETNKRGGEVK